MLTLVRPIQFKSTSEQKSYCCECLQIQEYTDTGSIAAARKIADSERFKSLSALTEIHGIGPLRARQHYEEGQRSVKDMLELYESNQKGKKILGVLAALRLHDELVTK